MNFIRLQVTWLKVDKGKFFEYISGRNPPFRNSTIEGAEIDVSIPKLSHRTNSEMSKHNIECGLQPNCFILSCM